MNPTTRALGATIVFAGVGMWALLFHNVPWEFLVPHAIFYAVLTLNTFYSVRMYTVIAPESAFQSLIDIALAASYIALGLTIGLPLAFSFCALIIFTIAPMKYAHMLLHTQHDATLKRKIMIDLLGTLMCAFVLGLTLIGLELKGAWILASLFALANIYLLYIKPMYFYEKEKRGT
jgi:hypothetical protein